MHAALSPRPLRVAIVAGEVSGDILAAGLMRELKALRPDVQFIGIAGPQMQAEGITSLFEMEELAVMGLVEVLGRLPRLLAVRRQLIRHLRQDPPDLYIGVDAPDFNLGVEAKLKRSGIRTVHYVSPSVWAWRQSRIHKIKAATDLVLAFLPFEKAFYDQYQAPCRFVGHTMADAIPLISDRQAACQRLGLDSAQRYLAVLPGSRQAEIEMLAPVFLETCRLLQATDPALRYIVPLVNARRRAQFEAILATVAPDLPITLFDGQARDAMAASSAILLASGTATLEAMLVKRPMVVAYRVKPFTYWLAERLVTIRTFALPNLLAGRHLVPELIQDDCTATQLADALLPLLTGDNTDLLAEFTRLHQLIRCNADKQAAEAVLELVSDR